MTTYIEPALSLDDKAVPERHLSFYRRHLQNAIYDFLITTFRRVEAEESLTKAMLSARIRRDRSAVTRWLSGPDNLTLNTISDLFVGMAVDPTTLLVDQLPVAPVGESAAQDAQPALPAVAPKKSDVTLAEGSAFQSIQKLTPPKRMLGGEFVREQPRANLQDLTQVIRWPKAVNE